MLKKVWKNAEKKLQKSRKILKKILKKFWKYVKMSYDIMSTAYQDNLGHKKLEWDKEQQTNVKDRAQSSRSKNFLLQKHLIFINKMFSNVSLGKSFFFKSMTDCLYICSAVSLSYWKQTYSTEMD